jgi:hypothetical protein
VHCQDPSGHPCTSLIRWQEGGSRRDGGPCAANRAKLLHDPSTLSCYNYVVDADRATIRAPDTAHFFFKRLVVRPSKRCQQRADGENYLIGQCCVSHAKCRAAPCLHPRKGVALHFILDISSASRLDCIHSDSPSGQRDFNERSKDGLSKRRGGLADSRTEPQGLFLDH